MICDKFSIILKLEERTLTSTFLCTYFWLTYPAGEIDQIERKINS